MHLKISRLFSWGHALAVKLNHDYLLVMKKMQFIFYSYCIHRQLGRHFYFPPESYLRAGAWLWW